MAERIQSFGPLSFWKLARSSFLFGELSHKITDRSTTTAAQSKPSAIWFLREQPTVHAEQRAFTLRFTTTGQLNVTASGFASPTARRRPTSQLGRKPAARTIHMQFCCTYCNFMNTASIENALVPNNGHLSLLSTEASTNQSVLRSSFRLIQTTYW
jgi:coproporphyrinogen III oxidase-like Fe-S oxidoreductase